MDVVRESVRIFRFALCWQGVSRRIARVGPMHQCRRNRVGERYGGRSELNEVEARARDLISLFVERRRLIAPHPIRSPNNLEGIPP